MSRKLGKKKQISEESKVIDYNVMVCTPAYDGKVDTCYSQSLAESAFCCPLFGVKLTASVMANGAFIDLARNIFVKMFLEQTEHTHLFFIDADLKFPSNAFIGLLRSGHDIVAGVYRRRQEDEDYPVKFADHPDSGGLWVEDEFLMAERVPTGFLCISRKVIEEMAEDAEGLKIHGQSGLVPRLFYTDTHPHSEGGLTFIGEDFKFCDDYRKKYKKNIPVWPNIDFVHGGYEGNLADWLEEKINQEASEQSDSAA